MPAGYCEPEGFARAKRRSAEGTPLGVSADSQIHPKRQPPAWVAAVLAYPPEANPKGSRERSDAPPTRRRQGAMAGSALCLPPCLKRLPLLFPKSRFAAIFGSPVITPLGVSADSQYTKNAATPVGVGTFVCPPLFWGRRAERCCLQFFPGAAKQKQPRCSGETKQNQPCCCGKDH